ARSVPSPVGPQPGRSHPRQLSPVSSSPSALAVGPAATVGGVRRVGRAAVHQVGEQIAALGLVAEIAQELSRDVVEGLLEAQTLAGALGDLVAAAGEIFLERFGVAGELPAELFDLAAQAA